MIKNIIGISATIAIVLSYIPQLKQTYTTKNVEGQNQTFWVLLTYSLAYLLYSAIESRNVMVILAQTFNFISALAMLIMVSKYKGDK